ncbi:glycosyltransferase [Bacteroides stercoris]|jgi:glycosyl transferase family protein|uniref:glycosyltransferase n=1 Tax=Bacteroides stercoris TaxID=46506 RepID=UPI001C2DDA02|nr:glycosyltransferase [Bacteroides stercoris]MBV1680226.1 glycosyltransferase [Bacteroides stercoris]
MENNTKILTIAIPTYNRIEQIQKQVRLLLPQLVSEVKLVVYDNHSNIQVSDLFTELELEKFLIIRNRVNIGGDANIARCFENCETKWLWTLSDDDWVQKDAISKILYYIRSNQDKTFINFWSPVNYVTENSEQFLRFLSRGDIFCSSFTMSACVYNMEILRDDLYFYYRNLSSMVGTLIMLTKNIIRTNGKCVWLNDLPIELGDDVGWNYSDFINYSFLFTLAFGDVGRSNYCKNIFIGLYKTDYSLICINRASSNVTWKLRLGLFCKVSRHQGFFNALRYCTKEYVKCLIFLFVGDWVKTLKPKRA